MVDEDPLMGGLLRAVEADPGNAALRVHVAEMLLQRGRAAEALEHCTRAVSADPASPEALRLLQEITAALNGASAPAEPPAPASPPPAPAEQPFDWAFAERQLGGDAFEDDPVDEPERLRLDDVAGMDDVKRRLNISFLGPLRTPELAGAYGKNPSGGLLLYGPPGCGKTFIARALAGEMNASFYPVEIADVLDAYVGQGERHVRQFFETARRNAPCVLFFDELDALGQKRSHLRNSSWLRTIVNSLLAEMDSVRGRNDGVFVLGATNHPWDVDSALRRPGRFDRMVLVLPPDDEARAAILRSGLRDRPVGDVRIPLLVKATDGFSGADLVHLVDSAAELALADAISFGERRPITEHHFRTALAEIRPSTGPWFQTAKNVAMFGNADGTYDELLAYLKRTRQL
ncbi:AAA family ATPase [Actinomadura gamaensis]|uniref:AAA family ATPase n=1 Tax=Actinomadura gamaensis TaxID=1763541 RepID=A0ABV9U195_9ACTN